MTASKDEVREIQKRWYELEESTWPFMPTSVTGIPRKRAREDDDVARSRPVPAGVQDAHSDNEPETRYYKTPSAPDCSSRHHIKDEHE